MQGSRRVRGSDPVDDLAKDVENPQLAGRADVFTSVTPGYAAVRGLNASRAIEWVACQTIG